MKQARGVSGGPSAGRSGWKRLAEARAAAFLAAHRPRWASRPGGGGREPDLLPFMPGP